MRAELTPDELRAALAAADRGIRLPWAHIVIAAAVSAFAAGIALKVLEAANGTHVLIVCAVVFLWGQLHLMAAAATSRQNAANARMLRALELLEQRLPEHQG